MASRGILDHVALTDEGDVRANKAVTITGTSATPTGF